MPSVRNVIKIGVLVGSAMFIGAATDQQKPDSGEWRTYGGDKAFTRYSSLDQINRDNVKNLQWFGGAAQWTLSSWTSFPT